MIRIAEILERVRRVQPANRLLRALYLAACRRGLFAQRIKALAAAFQSRLHGQ